MERGVAAGHFVLYEEDKYSFAAEEFLVFFYPSLSVFFYITSSVPFYSILPFISSCKLKYSYRGCDNSYIFVELTLTEIDIWVLFKKFTRSILFLVYRRSPRRRFDISSRVDIELIEIC